MNTQTIIYASATTLAHAIRNREISAEAVVQSHLDRLYAINPVLNTILQIAPDSALAQARSADEALASGRNLGPLHGVPFTVKDVYPVMESATLVDAPGMASRPNDAVNREATVVTRLRASGAILIATTRATLWADREKRYGPAYNPYDLTRDPGGSSGGEAATIAAGGSPLGIGSDSGGSLRMPAHFCGIATLRPSNGRVPRGVDADGANDPRTVAGPLARSVEDLALALSVIGGIDPYDAATLPIPLGDYRRVGIKGLRVAVFTDNGLAAPTAETAATVLGAAKALEEAGAHVETAVPPNLDEAYAVTQEYWRYCREVGDVATYFRFLERWDKYRTTLNLFREPYDLICCPVEAYPAYATGATELPVAFTYTTPFSLVGWPSAVVRAGTSPEGLPIGVQLVAAPWRDDVALAAAAHIEGVCGGWQRPNLTLDKCL